MIVAREWNDRGADDIEREYRGHEQARGTNCCAALRWDGFVLHLES